MSSILTKTSKFLSYVLRHNPSEIGIKLDAQGWVSIDKLIQCSNQYGHSLERGLLEEVVQTNDKQRFAVSVNGLMIRANQGHSIQVNLDLTPITPPTVLFHGTAQKWIDLVKQKGLKKMSRHHVHLTENIDVAKAVGRRYGKLVMLTIDSNKMGNDGFEFFKTANNVWLVEEVPSRYLIKVHYD